MWTKEEVVPILLSKNKSRGCSHSPETAALCMLAVVAFIFFCLVTANLRCCSPLKLCRLCDQRGTYGESLVVSVFLEVTLKNHPYILFPRGFSKVF